MRQLMPHQERALNYARQHRTIGLFMEMRLGKTLVAIRWATALQCRRVLVVCPMAVLPVWQEELTMEGQSPEVVDLLVGPSTTRLAQASNSKAIWSLTNYEGLRACPAMALLSWDCVILDESTRIRNPKTEITRLLDKTLAAVRYRAILSGLPAPQSALDYFHQMKFLDGSFLGCFNYWVFRQRHFDSGFNGWSWEPKPKTLERIKTAVHARCFVLTRANAGIGSKKIYEKRIVPMTPEQTAEYKQIQKQFSATFADGEIRMTQWTVVQMQWLNRVAGGFGVGGALLSDNKIKELRNLLTSELVEEQVVVWFRYNLELRTAQDALTAARISCASIEGATPIHARTTILGEFKRGNLRVLLMQLKVGKFGLNLSNSSTAIYFSNSYDLEDRLQSEERILDPRKEDPLLYLDLISQNSTDEVTYEALRDKKVASKFFMAEIIRLWKERYARQH